MLSQADLFARLAEGLPPREAVGGHAAGVTVVTPNRRLARALTAEFDAHQVSRGLPVWEAPDILPLGAFVQRLYEDLLYSDADENLPLLLTAAQEQVLWQEIVTEANLLSAAQTAAQCRDAWRLAHAWRIPLAGGGEDAQAFREWARKYEARTRGEIDVARLPDWVLTVKGRIKSPELLVACGFDIVPTQTHEFFSAFKTQPCKSESAGGSALRTSFPSARRELEAAAAWARARLEEGRNRIGVVVPELGQRRREVLRVFSRVMQPAYNLPDAASTSRCGAMPFNVSLGEPLAEFPLVDFALGLIRLSFQEVEFSAASRLLRSPFLGGAETEMTQRARLDADLRETLGATVSLVHLIASAGPCPRLRSLLENIFSLREETRQTHAFWARHFSALLEAAGFPGERTLDSDELQARAKWHEVLGELAKLERISKPLSIDRSFVALKQLCRDTLFQPESPTAPIQVLGVLESTGLRFDCLWVSGLTDEAWPLPAKPNPFVALAAQKKAGVPQASPEASAALDRRLTDEWVASAPEVVVSWPAKEQDRDLAPSPLIAGIAEGPLELAEFPRYRDVLFSKKKLFAVQDGKGPPVPPGPVKGGTRVLADQAACPFRAFARHRLAAERLEAPLDGPDASERGKLLHTLMKEIWNDLKDSAALHSQNLVPVIRRAADAAVKEAGLEGRFAELERVRLAKLAGEWLEVERNRKAFEVVSTEEKRTLSIAGLEFSSRIDRMDRLLEGEGGHLLIDYKTGYRVTPKDWEPPRPDDPQLPLYAVSAPEALSAVAFAKVRPGAMRFTGFSKAKGLVPNVREAKHWPSLLADWKKEADALAGAFASGEAAVDPKRDLKTCLRCDLQPLCRVYEKFNVLEQDEDEQGAE